MIVFYTSTFGFLLLFLSDYIQIRNQSRKSFLYSSAGYSIIAVTLLYTLTNAPGFNLYPITTVLGFMFTSIFSGLLIYSLLIEIPLIRRKRELRSNEAITEGTYGLCRHPGFIWFLMLMPSLYLIHRNVFFLGLSVYMIILNLFLIHVEDRYLFPKIFKNYTEYQDRVPFLIPLSRFDRE